jgi:hypothetical protein
MNGRKISVAPKTIIVKIPPANKRNLPIVISLLISSNPFSTPFKK